MTDLPAFVPHPLFRGGHAQTLAGAFLPGPRYRYRAALVRVPLPDGDTLVLHDDRPAGWQTGDPAALLVHGLAGCHQSGYMERIAAKLNAAGVRAFRMDLRGCGAGEGLACRPYHAGRSDDALAALQTIERLCPGSPLSLIGFSLGGNIALKLLGESPDDLSPALASAVAVSPPIDLDACVRSLDRFWCRFYDRHFTRLLNRRAWSDAGVQRIGFPPSGGSGPAEAGTPTSRPRGLREFDDRYTAPRSGFASADEYYARCSSAQFIPRIRIATRILTAADDPMIPIRVFDGIDLPRHVRLHVTDHGGHLGFVARRGPDADCRWMDWRVVEWVLAARATSLTASAQIA